MKKLLFYLFLVLIFSCKKSSINAINSNLQFELPSGYKILKDTTFYKNDLKVQVDLKYSKNEINYLIKKIKVFKRFDLVKNPKGYELSFTAKDLGEIIQIQIDTIDNVLKYREYHN